MTKAERQHLSDLQDQVIDAQMKLSRFDAFVEFLWDSIEDRVANVARTEAESVVDDLEIVRR